MRVYCSTHQLATNIKWLLCRASFYWPNMMLDYFRYKGCEECQRFGNIQPLPIVMLYPIIKLWSFHGWGLDSLAKFIPHHQRDIILCWLLYINSLSGLRWFLYRI